MFSHYAFTWDCSHIARCCSWSCGVLIQKVHWEWNEWRFGLQENLWVHNRNCTIDHLSEGLFGLYAIHKDVAGGSEIRGVVLAGRSFYVSWYHCVGGFYNFLLCFKTLKLTKVESWWMCSWNLAPVNDKEIHLNYRRLYMLKIRPPSVCDLRTYTILLIFMSASICMYDNWFSFIFY